MVFFTDGSLLRLTSMFSICICMLIIVFISWRWHNNAPTFSKNKENYHIPKTIWTYHPNETPTSFEQWCLESWRHHHPNFKVNVLTPKTWKGYVRILDPEKDAPLLRDQERWKEALELHILEEHGGVWLDSHVYLHECLENWLFPRHGECAGFHYTSTEYHLHDKNGKILDEIPLLDKRCLASEKGNPLIRQWRDEYMRILSYPSIDAYLKSIYTYTPINQFTFPVEWVMPLSLQHVLLKSPYPMESIILHSSEDGPLRHEKDGKGDQKKADDLGKKSKERIIFFKEIKSKY